MYYKQVLSRIKKELKKSGVRKLKIAEVLGTPKEKSNSTKSARVKSFFSTVESGKINFYYFKKVADFLGIPEQYLLFGDNVHIEHDKAKYKIDNPEITKKKAEILERIAGEKDPEMIKILTEALKAV